MDACMKDELPGEVPNARWVTVQQTAAILHVHLLAVIEYATCMEKPSGLCLDTVQWRVRDWK